MSSIKQTIWHLQQSNQKAYYLAFLRVALCAWFLKELLFRWPAFEILYSTHSFLKIRPSDSFHLFHLDLFFLKEHYLVVVWACVVLLLLNIFGIGKNIVSLLVFLMLTLLYNINNKFSNGGDEMSLLLAFYLSFANTFSHFTLFKPKEYALPKQKIYNLISNLAVYAIIINLSLSYFMSGWYKLQDTYWLRGTGMYYILNDERFSILAAGGRHISAPAILVYFLTYSTILFEIGFPFFVYFRRSKRIVLILGLLMHLGIYIFLMIYGLSVIFVIQYGLFFSDEETTAAVKKVKRLVKFKRNALPETQ